MTMNDQKDTIKKIHSLTDCGVFWVAGGGAGLLTSLLEVPGASNTVLECIVPYSARSMERHLGYRPEKFCSEGTARRMAMAAYRVAVSDGGTFGFAITAALATNREKKGPCRAHVAYQDSDVTLVWKIDDVLGSGPRNVQEAMVSSFGLICLDEALSMLNKDNRLRYLMEGSANQVRHDWNEPIHAVMPGSFNPMHEGHVKMQQDASKRLGCKVYFELCINNADKGYIDYIDINNRMAQMDPTYNVITDVIYTNVPLFIDKARAFNGCLTFVVGIDTLKRIADPIYYGSYEARDEMLTRLYEMGCEFLVYGRMIDGKFRSIRDMRLPVKLENMCREVTEEGFRVDISSTDIRDSSDA